MPIMCVFRIPNVTSKDYDNVRREVRWEDDLPPGGIAHFISFTKDGAVEFDVWESREAFETFFETRHEKVLDKLKLDMGTPEIHELQGLMIADLSAVKVYMGPRRPGSPMPQSGKASGVPA